jgi:hypothetical protein
MPERVADISRRFEANLVRVTGLTTAYSTTASGRGRASVVETDILRAAVVLLHASFEDLLRSLEELLLPTRPAEVFREWPFALPSAPKKPLPRLTLYELLEYRGKSVEDVLTQAIRRYLETSNYNNFAEVRSTVLRLGLDPAHLTTHAGQIEALMKRRHWIAHRADRNPNSGQGQYVAQHLDVNTVTAWHSIVTTAGREILGQL